MSFFRDHKTVFLLGSSVLAATAGALYYMTNLKQKKEIQQDYEQKVHQIESKNEPITIQNHLEQEPSKTLNEPIQILQEKEEEQTITSQKTKTSQASSKVRKFLDGSEHFDITTVTAILEASLDYVDSQYVLFTQTNREERRKVRLVDIERYKELVLEYNAQIEKFILSAQDQLLADVNINKQQFEQSVEKLIQNGFYQQLYMIQSAIRQKVSEKLPRTKPVSKETIKQIIQFQLHSLVNSKDTFLAVISQLQFVPDIAELIPYVLNTMIQDMIFEKFQVEEEDQMSQMNAQEYFFVIPLSDILEDTEIHSLLAQIEEAMLNLMSSLGLTYIDEEEEEEEEDLTQIESLPEQDRQNSE